MQILVDGGDGPAGGRARFETFEVADQYTLQGNAFSRAVLGEKALASPIEDAVADMRVIKAVFCAAASSACEAVT